MGLPDFGIIIFEKTRIKKKTHQTKQQNTTNPARPRFEGILCIQTQSGPGDFRDFLLFPNDLQPQKNNQPTNQAAGGIRYVPIFFFPLQLTQPLSSSWWFQSTQLKNIDSSKMGVHLPQFSSWTFQKLFELPPPSPFYTFNVPLFFLVGNVWRDASPDVPKIQSNPTNRTDPGANRCFPLLSATGADSSALPFWAQRPGPGLPGFVIFVLFCLTKK